MRTDRFQPQGPVRGPVQDPPWLALLRSVPLAVVLGLIGGVFGWGVRYATFASESKETTERIVRLEASQVKEVAALRADVTERLTRIESAVNMRFDAWDKRSDGRMAMLTGRFEKTDARADEIVAGLNRLENRLTRVEALREFNAANGPGKR